MFSILYAACMKDLLTRHVNAHLYAGVCGESPGGVRSARARG